MDIWMLLGGTLVCLAITLYLRFILVTMDPRVKRLAELAYACAGEIAGLPAKGSPPPVNLKSERWMYNGVSVVGNYKWSEIPGGKVIWDSILVLDHPDSIWSILVHEMTHAVRRRAGKRSSEFAAEAAEAQANSRCGSAEVDALVGKFR